MLPEVEKIKQYIKKNRCKQVRRFLQIISVSDRLSLHKREDARNRQPAPGMYYEKVYSK